MTRTIYVPDDEAGDEALLRIIPSLWKASEGERKKR